MSNLVIRTWTRRSFKIGQTYLYLPMLSKIGKESLGSFIFGHCLWEDTKVGVSCYPFFLWQKQVSRFHTSLWPCDVGFHFAQPQRTLPLQSLLPKLVLYTDHTDRDATGNSVFRPAHWQGPGITVSKEWTLDHAWTTNTVSWGFRGEDKRGSL